MLGSKLLKFNFTHLSEKISVIFTVVHWKNIDFLTLFPKFSPWVGKKFSPGEWGKIIFEFLRIPHGVGSPGRSPTQKVPGSNPGQDKLFVKVLEGRFYFILSTSANTRCF